jgi:hypothetical protein
VIPGPWSLDTCDWPLIVASDEGERCVCALSLPDGSIGDDAAGMAVVATGRAIAALPELLAALRELVEQIDGIGVPDWNGAEGLDMTRARAILAKVQP